MIAFIKRRWMLLACAMALLACSVVDFQFASQVDKYYWRIYGTKAGEFFTSFSSHESQRFKFTFHKPATSLRVRCRWSPPRCRNMWITIWLPFSAVLGWVVFRELRWREKSAMTPS